MFCWEALKAMHLLSKMIVVAAGEGLLADRAGGASKLAALFYQQMEATLAKESDLAQAAKCLVFLSLHLYQGDEAAGRLPAQHAVTEEAGTPLVSSSLLAKHET